MKSRSPRSLAGRSLPLAAVAAMLAVLPLTAQVAEKVDYDAIYRIKDEGFQRSKVMDIASWLTDVHGPRLTGSPGYNAAVAWAQSQFNEWGLANVKKEAFPFGRGWSNDRFAAHVTAPSTYPLIGYPKAWTPGTNGVVKGEAVVAVMDNEADFEQFRGKLQGKLVLAQPMREVKAAWAPLAERYTDPQLTELATPEMGGNRSRRDYRALQAFTTTRNEFLRNEGVVAVLEASRIGDGGTVFVQGGGSRDAQEPPAPLQIVLAVEHYGRIWRTLERKVLVTIELDVRSTFHDDDPNSYNLTAEIPGTDKDKASELVMLGGHFDSWHSGTGATDNAAGSAVMMEAIRILKTSGLRMKRTVRIALWGGEEQGLLGSKAYVKEHFADRETMALRVQHAKLSAYFNVDNGTGAIRGVYQQSNEAVVPIFRAWMEPFATMGVTTLTSRNTGGTDHLSFDGVGLPGFQFIQDEVEYDTRTHHSNMDTWERLQAPDMMKNAVIVATFVYHAANRDQMIPRKPLPKPEPPQTPRPTPTAGQ